MNSPFRSTSPSERISVVVVNWNGERYLERCLEALFAQTLAPAEIILVDNGSTDRSLEIAARFPQIRVIALQENTGFARGNNIAIRAAAADSKWIALMNPDAFAQPDWLATLAQAAHRSPAFSVFGSKLVVAADPSILDGAGDTYHLSGLVWREGHGASSTQSGQNECEIFSPCAAAAMYRREAIDAIGGFDEDYFCYVEDIDLAFRLRLAGHRCLYVPDSVAHHVGSGLTGGQHSDFSVYHGHRNLVWTFVKDMPGVLFWLLLPLHLVMNLATITIFTLRGRGRLILRAKRDALCGLPKAWAKRRRIQRARSVGIGAIWTVLNRRLIPRRGRRI